MKYLKAKINNHTIHSILRFRKCYNCPTILIDEINNGRPIYKSKKHGRRIYFCESCKHDLFEGVKLRL